VFFIVTTEYFSLRQCFSSSKLSILALIDAFHYRNGVLWLSSMFLIIVGLTWDVIPCILASSVVFHYRCVLACWQVTVYGACSSEI